MAIQLVKGKRRRGMIDTQVRALNLTPSLAFKGRKERLPEL